jgi:hypothetical protein
VTHFAALAGEDTSVFVHLGVNVSKAFAVRMYQESAIQPFYSEDGVQQAKLEDDLWNGLIQNELIQSEQNQGTALQLSANNQDVGIPLSFKSISASLLNTINTEQGRYYFLCQLQKADRKSILDVCFSIDKKGNLLYCRSHNGP